MANNSYQDFIKRQMGKYKANNKVLQNLPNGTFGGRAGYSHILDKNDVEHNMIDPVLISPVISLDTSITPPIMRQSSRHSFHLHKYAHHLNSSQMMCINFFAPFMASGQSHVLLKLLGFSSPNRGISEFEFEHVENNSELTHFDFYVKTTDGIEIFFEIKYTEAEFSKHTSAKTASKQHRWRNIYSQSNATNPHFVGILEDEFYNDYQIFRNLYYATNPSNFVLFIVPKANTALVDQLFNRGVSVNMVNNAQLIYWEDLITDCMNEFKANNALLNYYIEFRDKYLP